jgi:hypothetical protein
VIGVDGVTVADVQAFRCGVCGHLVFFDNSVCLRCGAGLAYDPEGHRLLTVRDDDDDGLRAVDGGLGTFRRCDNLHLARCNWVVAADDPYGLCVSCRLTSVRPADDDAAALEAYADAESAKRRLLHQLIGIGLPVVDRHQDPERGLTFEMLSSRGRSVTTGHQGGVITLDLSESDDAHREFVRQQLGEQYRTVLGHLRHEIGHYYWPFLVEGTDLHAEFRELFGDERVSYQEALERHYAGGSPAVGAEWVDTHVSKYATMHPWEDWAETFAHYLHIQAGLQTADAFGLSVGQPSSTAGAEAWSATDDVEIGPMIASWLGLTFALNGMSRTIGQNDLYPFVLSGEVVVKLDFVHRAVRAGATASSV